MENLYTIEAYLIYLPLALLMTFFVARTLFKNSRVFMLDIFKGREDIAFATNRLFEIGFYLLNVGTALLILKIYRIDDAQEMVEALSFKLGGFSIYLGIMLFINLYFFFRGKRKANATPAPVGPGRPSSQY
jgi:uncharacterized membrane protein